MTANNDPSLRFVLPQDAAYLNNLAALWARQPQLARLIEAVDSGGCSADSTDPRHGRGRPCHDGVSCDTGLRPVPAGFPSASQDRHTSDPGSPGVLSYHLEPSKSGAPTLYARTTKGRVVHLHSRYQPVDEATRLIDAIDTTQTVAFYVQGLGLGYHLEALFDRTAEDAIICVFEPDARLMRIAFEQRDLSRIIQSGRVMWFWHTDKADLFTRLGPWQPSITMGFGRITHAPSVQLWPHFHQQMQTYVEEFRAYAATSVTTLVLNGKRTAQNVARNLPWYVAAPSVARLKDRYKGWPAIIVSAGPSLRKNKHLLKEVQDSAVLVAVQTTLQPLLEMGIEPHFVTSLDYHDISTRFWEKLPRTLRTELVAEPKASSAIFDLNPGPLSLLGNDFAENLLSELKLNQTKLPSGATVAHLAYYVAEHLGCDPIIFIGQDLGFSDGLCYTPGTSYEDVWRPELGRFCTLETKQWEQIVRDRQILRKVPDYQGRPMYTEERLFTYLQHFERDFSKTRTRIIDATEGGAFKRGTTPMILRDAIERFCRRPLPVSRLEHPGLRWDMLLECKPSLQNRRREARQIERISQETLPLLEEIRDHIQDQQRVNRTIVKIDALRARMADLSACYTLVMQLTQDSELKRFKADRRISASGSQGTARQQQQVQRDIENVRHVIQAAIDFQSLMEETIQRIDLFAGRHRQQREAA